MTRFHRYLATGSVNVAQEAEEESKGEETQAQTQA